MCRIWVDADACPVKQEIVAAAKPFQAEVVFAASIAHSLERWREEGVRIIQLDPSDQSVDMYIANQLQAGDILVTQDLGLSALAMGKKAIVLSNRGQILHEEQMDYLLAARHAHARIRRGGGRTKGPKALTKEDRSNFQQTLTKVLAEQQEKRLGYRIDIRVYSDEGGKDE
ncbi:YaiI/YqxD family protein [Xylanibacillus composti]|uniref:YaiI/YqxD family protein n=1 Tax=Xylanibacillus composti TaxID=1572762 RepID=UPI0027E4F7EC|nr:YaiI/YqxD family protein [Xylanibacillus composti]